MIGIFFIFYDPNTPVNVHGNHFGNGYYTHCTANLYEVINCANPLAREALWRWHTNRLFKCGG